jgi:uncharacterized OsmC-like protein
LSNQRILNGVDVDVVNGVINAITENPELAKSKFRVNNKWIDGGHNRTIVLGFYSAGQEIFHTQQFVLDADEPPIMAGLDQAPSPVEHLLNALVTWMTTTMVYQAAVGGIRLDEVESAVEGDLDLRGFLAISDQVRPGYQEIRVNFKVRTDLENMETLKDLMRLSPVYDVVKSGPRVIIQVERKWIEMEDKLAGILSDIRLWISKLNQKSN